MSIAHPRVCPETVLRNDQSPAPHRGSKISHSWVYVEPNRSALRSRAYVYNARSYHPSPRVLAWTSTHAHRSPKDVKLLSQGTCTTVCNGHEVLVFVLPHKSSARTIISLCRARTRLYKMTTLFGISYRIPFSLLSLILN